MNLIPTTGALGEMAAKTGGVLQAGTYTESLKSEKTNGGERCFETIMINTSRYQRTQV